MKTLQEHKKDFLKKAREYDMGKTDEDFHSYMRQNNLEHHLSETQIQDRNRENNSLNGLGLVAGIAIPLTFGAIFGMNKIMKDTMNSVDEVYQNLIVDDVAGEPLQYFMQQSDNSALSGTNTRPMPRAESHIGQFQDFPNVPQNYNFAGMTNTGKSKAYSSTIRSNTKMDRGQMMLEDTDALSRQQIFYRKAGLEGFPDEI
tara:strand:+ start:837 stop:1439 length:603 start_codon:yes stop_codon:yes gene_type:complete